MVPEDEFDRTVKQFEPPDFSTLGWISVRSARGCLAQMPDLVDVDTDRIEIVDRVAETPLGERWILEVSDDPDTVSDFALEFGMEGSHHAPRSRGRFKNSPGTSLWTCSVTAIARGNGPCVVANLLEPAHG